MDCWPLRSRGAKQLQRAGAAGRTTHRRKNTSHYGRWRWRRRPGRSIVPAGTTALHFGPACWIADRLGRSIVQDVVVQIGQDMDATSASGQTRVCLCKKEKETEIVRSGVGSLFSWQSCAYSTPCSEIDLDAPPAYINRAALVASLIGSEEPSY